MLNTTIIDRKVTKQEVNNYTETNVEASGNISKTESATRFININKSNQSFTTVFSSSPFYVEIEQKQDGETDAVIGRHSCKTPYYKTIKTKISIQVKQVLVVGSDYTLEIVETSREDISDMFNGDKNKNTYFNTPTIL